MQGKQSSRRSLEPSVFGRAIWGIRYMNDLEKAVVEGTAAAIKDLCRDFTSGLVSLSRKQLDRLSVDLETAFRNYLERSVRRISKIKTLLTPNTPVNLENSYIPVSLIRGNEHDRTLMSENEFLSAIRNPSCVVITGVGGCGKSVFLKHLFIRLYNEHIQKVQSRILVIPPKSGWRGSS
jgi:hypothetical protein